MLRDAGKCRATLARVATHRARDRQTVVNRPVDKTRSMINSKARSAQYFPRTFGQLFY
jgi:hypothetical protein